MIYKHILLLLYCIMQNLWINGVKAVRSSKQDNPALKKSMDEKGRIRRQRPKYANERSRYATK